MEKNDQNFSISPENSPSRKRVWTIFNKKILSGLFFFLLTLIGLISVYFLAQSNQDIRQQAAGDVYVECSGGVVHGGTTCGSTTPDSCLRCNNGRLEPAPGQCTAGPCAPQNQVTDLSCSGGVAHGGTACGDVTPESCLRCNNGKFVPAPGECSSGPCAPQNKVVDLSCSGGVAHGATACGGSSPDSCLRCNNGQLESAPGECRSGPCSSPDPVATAPQKKSSGSICNTHDDCASNNCMAFPGGKVCQPPGTTTASQLPTQQTTVTPVTPSGRAFGSALQCATACNGSCTGPEGNICVSAVIENSASSNQTSDPQQEFEVLTQIFTDYVDGKNNVSEVIAKCRQYLGKDNPSCGNEQAAATAVFGINASEYAEINDIRGDRIVERLLDTDDPEWDTSGLELTLNERVVLGTMQGLQSLFGDSASGYVNTFRELNQTGNTDFWDYERWRASIELGGKVSAGIVAVGTLGAGAVVAAGGAGLTAAAGYLTTGLAVANLSSSTSQTAIACQTAADWQNNPSCQRAAAQTGLAAANTVLAPIAATSAVLNAGGTATGLVSSSTAINSVVQNANLIRYAGVTLGAGNTLVATNIAQEICEENPSDSSCNWAIANAVFAGGNTIANAATPLLSSVRGLERTSDVVLAVSGGALDAQAALNDCVISGGDFTACSIAIGQFFAGTTQDISQIRNSRIAQTHTPNAPTQSRVGQDANMDALRTLQPETNQSPLTTRANQDIPDDALTAALSTAVIANRTDTPTIADVRLNTTNEILLLPSRSSNQNTSDIDTATARSTDAATDELTRTSTEPLETMRPGEAGATQAEPRPQNLNADTPRVIRSTDNDLIGNQVAAASSITPADILRVAVQETQTRLADAVFRIDTTTPLDNPIARQTLDQEDVQTNRPSENAALAENTNPVEVARQAENSDATPNQENQNEILTDSTLMGQQIAAASSITPGDVIRTVAQATQTRITDIAQNIQAGNIDAPRTNGEINGVRQDPVESDIIGDQIGRAVESGNSVAVAKILGEEVVQGVRHILNRDVDSNLPQQLRAPRKPILEVTATVVRNKSLDVIADLQVSKPFRAAQDALQKLNQTRVSIQQSLATKTVDMYTATKNSLQEIKTEVQNISALRQTVDEDVFNTTVVINRKAQNVGQEFLIGRNLFVNEANKSYISQSHASVFTDSSGMLKITDYSMNGTYVNGRRLATGVTTVLKAGDVVDLGLIDANDPIPAFASTFRVVETASRYTLQNNAGTSLGIVNKPQNVTNIRVPVTSDEIAVGIIGRSNDLNDPYISRYHAEVRSNELGVISIKDNKSVNGTFVNNQRLRTGEVRPLREGDIIRLGRKTLLVGFDASGKLSLLNNNQPISLDNIADTPVIRQIEEEIPQTDTSHRISAATDIKLEDWRGYGTISEELARNFGYSNEPGQPWLYYRGPKNEAGVIPSSQKAITQENVVKVELQSGGTVDLEYKVHVAPSARDFNPIMREMSAYIRELNIVHKVAPGIRIVDHDYILQHGKAITIYANDPQTLQLIAAKAQELAQRYQGIPHSALVEKGANLQYEMEVPGTNGILYYTVESINGHYLGGSEPGVFLGNNKVVQGYKGRMEVMRQAWGQGPLDHLWE